jgi:SAM-dependent methyltransferase
MPNDEMTEFWNERGGRQWVRERARYDAMLASCGRRLFEAVALQAGERVLDVGCGNGATTLEAATLIGPEGSVLGVDLSGPMLEEARRRADEVGANRVEFMQLDAQTAALPGPFDAMISRFGVMFFDDRAKAFENLAQSIGPGGRMCFVCWQEMMKNEWLRVPLLAAVEHVGIPDLPVPGAPGPFSLAESSTIRGLLESVGMTDIAVEEGIDQRLMGRDLDDVMSFFLADEFARRLLDDKDPELVRRAEDAMRDALRPYVGSDGVSLGSAYWIVSAKRAS